MNSGAAADLALGPDPAAMLGDDTLDDRQTDPGSGKLLRSVQPLEGAEKLADILHIESGAVVLDEEHSFAVLRAGAELDRRVRLPAGELDGVVQQVTPDALQHPRIATDMWQRPNLDLDGAPGHLRVQIAQRFGHQRRHIGI